MICLHCGYCCIEYFVPIIKDINKPINEENIEIKDSQVKCRHLVGEKPGEYICDIHDSDVYKETPCYAHTQIEREDTPCRTGNYLLNERKNIKTKGETEK